jgi:CysZ protein
MKEIKILFQSFNEGIDMYKNIKFKGKKLIPILLIIILFILYRLAGEQFSSFLIEILKSPLNKNVFTDKFIRIIVKIFMFIIYFYTYKFIVLATLSPFMSIMSEKCEEEYEGRSYKFGITKNIKFILRAFGLSIVNFAIEMFFTFFFFIMGVFLPFKLVFYIFTIIIQSFFIGYSFVDFAYERKEWGIRESIKNSFSNFIILSILGLLFLMFFNIPIIGVIYGPFYFTIVGTLYVIKKNKK